MTAARGAFLSARALLVIVLPGGEEVDQRHQFLRVVAWSC